MIAAQQSKKCNHSAQRLGPLASWLVGQLAATPHTLLASLRCGGAQLAAKRQRERHSLAAKLQLGGAQIHQLSLGQTRAGRQND